MACELNFSEDVSHSAGKCMEVTRSRVAQNILPILDTQTVLVKVGKVADLVLIDGDPSVRIGDLRQTRVVMMGDKLLDAGTLRSVSGFSGWPK